MNTGSDTGRKTIFFLAFIFLSIIYIFACIVTLRNSRAAEKLTPGTVNIAKAESDLRNSFLYDGDYFRQLAEKLQFVPRSSSIVERCYETALQKSPADYKNFSSYAGYLQARNCCAEKLSAVVDGLVLRSPANPDIHVRAGQLLLAAGNRPAALMHFKHALEEGGTLSPSVRKQIESGGKGLQDLVAITPRQAAPLLDLARYLLAKGSAAETLRRGVFKDLAAARLEPGQRVAFGRLALQAGDIDLAHDQAILAKRSDATRVAVLQLLAEIAAEQQDWTEYQKVSKEMRDFNQKEGKQDQSCEIALKTLGRGKKHPKDLAQKLSRIVEAYPDCVSAYSQLARVMEPESPDISIAYLQKAATLAPQNFKVSNQLAEIYVKQSKIVEAEAIYVRFLQSPSDSTAAFIGLSRCKLARHDYRAAELALKEAIELNENRYDLWRELGKLYSAEGNLVDAAKAYSHYASFTPDKPEGYLLAGDAYRKLGRNEAARRQYEQALTADSGNRRALESLRSLSARP
jgi:tetratricopeptide (TPR) repeat protein